MEKMFYSLFVVTLLFPFNTALANRYYNYPENSYRSTEDTHYVRPYTREDGTYVEGHQSGNPNSGVHCHNNICY